MLLKPTRTDARKRKRRRKYDKIDRKTCAKADPNCDLSEPQRYITVHQTPLPTPLSQAGPWYISGTADWYSGGTIWYSRLDVRAGAQLHLVSVSERVLGSTVSCHRLNVTTIVSRFAVEGRSVCGSGVAPESGM